jgi:hypothetical protein
MTWHKRDILLYAEIIMLWMDHLQILMMVHSDNGSSTTGYRSDQEPIALEENENNRVQDVKGFQCMASVCLFTWGGMSKYVVQKEQFVGNCVSNCANNLTEASDAFKMFLHRN